MLKSKVTPATTATDELLSLNRAVDSAREALEAATRKVQECEVALTHAEDFNADVAARAAVRQAKADRQSAQEALVDIENAARPKVNELQSAAINEIIGKHRTQTAPEYRQLCAGLLAKVREVCQAIDTMNTFCTTSDAGCEGVFGTIGVQAQARLHQNHALALYPARGHLENAARSLAEMLK